MLAPFAELLSFLPEDRIYAPVDVHEKGRSAGIYTRNLIKKGIVPYDAMIPTTRTILKKPGVRDRICGRIAFIFVDEFQDADIGMIEVFEHFRKSAKTTLFVVGDPEQYLMSFAYRGQRPPAFDKIPFFRFKKLAQSEPIIENHRSNGEIVTFANQFREDLQQKVVKPYRNEHRVLFIPTTVLEEIKFIKTVNNCIKSDCNSTTLHCNRLCKAFSATLRVAENRGAVRNYLIEFFGWQE